jgi:peroxiredoxin
MRYLFIAILSLVFVVPTFAQTELRIGSPAPAFSGASMAGTYYDLDNLRGNIVVMTFWSTKCQICHSEIPKLNSFKSRFDQDKVKFLALTNENESRVESYLKSNRFEFEILPSSFAVVLQYADRDRQGNINMGYPSYFLIDQEGIIVYRSNGWDKTDELESKITRMLAAKSAAAL